MYDKQNNPEKRTCGFNPLKLVANCLNTNHGFKKTPFSEKIIEKMIVKNKNTMKRYKVLPQTR